jgi:hypothetical protein
VAPETLLETTSLERGTSLSLIGDYIGKYPLGTGLGTVGPAATYANKGSVPTNFNGETEFNFLLLELGVAGALIFLAFVLRLIAFAVVRIRRLDDPELRVMMAALAAPLCAMAIVFTSGAPTTGSPGGAYLWGIGGVLAYWLGTARQPRRGSALHRPR